MEQRFSRTAMLLGKSAMERLSHAHIALFGVGGVGGAAAEALMRCGIGAIDLIDKDTVSESNINRQIIALSSTIGKSKVDVMRDRIAEINPQAVVRTYETFYLPETAAQFDFTQYDYIIDAIDTVTAKLSLIEQAKKGDVPIISAMGAGNKLDPSAFRVSDISKTSVCPLARIMRRELKKRGITSLKVVYSQESPRTPFETPEEYGKHLPGSISFVPTAAGLVLAGEVIRDLAGISLT